MLNKSTDNRFVNFVNECFLHKGNTIFKISWKTKGLQNQKRPKPGVLHRTTSFFFKSTPTSILLNGNMLQILSTGYEKLTKLNE